MFAVIVRPPPELRLAADMARQLIENIESKVFAAGNEGQKRYSGEWERRSRPLARKMISELIGGQLTPRQIADLQRAGRSPTALET